jgi:Tol biopolymer transport system component
MSHTTGSDIEGSWITFLSHRSGNNRLYRMHPDGSDLSPVFGGQLDDVPGLREGQVLYRQPHWSRQSPDHRFFLSWARDVVIPEENCRSPVRFMIYLGRTDGGPVRVLAPDGGEVFCWAHDSRSFAYTRRPVPDTRTVTGLGPRIPSTQVVIAAIDGSIEEVVLEKAGCWTACDWSPHGQRLLLLYQNTGSPNYGRWDLIELDLHKARYQRERMAELRPGDDFASSRAVEGCLRSVTDGLPIAWFAEPRYSPDGSRIATIFSRRARLTDPGLHELGVIDVANERLEAIAEYRHPDRIHGPICWSPDGTEILIARPLPPVDRRENLATGEPGLSIWAIRPDGMEARFLTTGWSPDWR